MIIVVEGNVLASVAKVTKHIGLGAQKSQTLSIPNMNVWIVTPGSNSCAAWTKLMDCMIGVWLDFLQCTLVTIGRRFPICYTSYFSVGSSCLCTPKTKAIHHHLPFLTSVRLCQKVASPSCDLLSMIAQLSTRWDIKVILTTVYSSIYSSHSEFKTLLRLIVLKLISIVYSTYNLIRKLLVRNIYYF